MLAYISIPVLDRRRKCHKHILHCFSLNTMFSAGKMKQENVMHEMGLPLATASAFAFVFRHQLIRSLLFLSLDDI